MYFKEGQYIYIYNIFPEYIHSIIKMDEKNNYTRGRYLDPVVGYKNAEHILN